MEDFFHGVSKAILEYWILICIVLGTSGMALMRTAKQNGKADYLEAGIGIGTYVSYIGTHRFSRWVSKKIGMEDK